MSDATGGASRPSPMFSAISAIVTLTRSGIVTTRVVAARLWPLFLMTVPFLSWICLGRRRRWRITAPS